MAAVCTAGQRWAARGWEPGPRAGSQASEVQSAGRPRGSPSFHLCPESQRGAGSVLVPCRPETTILGVYTEEGCRWGRELSWGAEVCTG